ncbi:MAG TPA: hypothetical protein DCF63_19800, partial [Planctomycetaceae bacterium]|nr:hypothetical protein [Planctomycetaceae bacterium]
MMTPMVFRLNRKACLAALLSMVYPMPATAAAARVEFSAGTAVAQLADGSQKPIVKGLEINAGDSILTQEGRVQLRFADGGYVSLQPNSNFKVEEYSYEGKTDGSEKGFFHLLKGGLRAITGAIGRENKNNYRVNTPVATIGIRGTEFLASYQERLLVRVGSGAIYLSNGAGDLVLYSGQSGEVTGANNRPGYTDDQPQVNAAGPGGAKPQEVQEDQEQQQQLTETFIAGDIRSDQGTQCLPGASGGGCSILDPTASQVAADIAFANANQYLGIWAASGFPMVASGGLGTANSTSAYIYIDFSNYYAESLVYGSFANGYLDGSANGSLNASNGAIAFSSGTVDALLFASSPCLTSCTFNVTNASIGGPALSQAQMTFSFGGDVSVSPTTLQMSGGVGPV